MEQIKAYLEGQTVDNTLHLLRQEADLVQEQLRELQAKAVLLEKRWPRWRRPGGWSPGWVARKTLPPRPCVLFTEHITRDEEMDFVMKKLHRQHEDKIRDFGNQIFGAFLAMEELMAGTPNVYDGVFSVVEEADACDFTLPGGTTSPSFTRAPMSRTGPWSSNCWPMPGRRA